MGLLQQLWDCSMSSKMGTKRTNPVWSVQQCQRKSTLATAASYVPFQTLYGLVSVGFCKGPFLPLFSFSFSFLIVLSFFAISIFPLSLLKQSTALLSTSGMTGCPRFSTVIQWWALITGLSSKVKIRSDQQKEMWSNVENNFLATPVGEV